jgi:hypothetical protein
MLRKAAAVGLPVDANLADRLTFDAAADIRPAKMGPMREFRKLSGTDRIHYTVNRRDVASCQNAPAGCPIETAEDERGSVVAMARAS